jgi:hypothetical protein
MPNKTGNAENFDFVYLACNMKEKACGAWISTEEYNSHFLKSIFR